ncbi:glycogenin 1 isoform X2 [Haematobia irritans]|uniref:glycogenin 1 isoform X2 n=1 Tax=Haematobia irritans TaxID=7368 RepID=UPI003F506796
MSKFAWVTLTTNDTYSLGALVLAHSLRRAGTVHQLAVLVTPGVSESMREKLRDVYNVVQEVNVMDSQDSANLALLSRPELGVTFTKLHCWRLVQFEKCVFLDADTLVLQNCDELFEREEFSAAPDVSWPDCFNSGVFVYKPSQATFDKIVEFAVKYGSFDGGDQGLLNQYFSDWATSDTRKRLPFLYNVTAYASYCYLPAFKQFRDKIKILHFAGKMKPWLIHFNSQSRVASVPSDYSHANDLIQLWWNIFFDNVHSQLTTNMRYSCPALVAWKSNYDNIKMQQQQQHQYYMQQQHEHEHKHYEYHHQSNNHNNYDNDNNNNNNSNYQHNLYVDNFYANQEIKFHDPWEDYYRKLEEEAERQRIKAEEEARRHFEYQRQQELLQQQQQYEAANNNWRESHEHNNEPPREQEYVREEYWHDDSHHHNPQQDYFYQEPEEHRDVYFYQEEEETEVDNTNPFTQTEEHHYQESWDQGKQDDSSNYYTKEEYYDALENIQEHMIQEPSYQESNVRNSNDECKCSSTTAEAEHITQGVLNNYDSSESNLRDQSLEINKDQTQNTNEHKQISRLSADHSETQQVTLNTNEEESEVALTNGEEAGLAGALSQLRLGEQRTPEQEEYEHLMRRQCWEAGQVDYMGRDSFDNIWKKITQTMESKPATGADKTGSS